nr:MAG TPA: hypothetical protein [Caudoviricetes sp.]
MSQKPFEVTKELFTGRKNLTMNKSEVKALLQRLDNLNRTSGASEGEELHVSPMFLDYANNYVKQLSELLGIELERGY